MSKWQCKAKQASQSTQWRMTRTWTFCQKTHFPSLAQNFVFVLFLYLYFVLLKIWRESPEQRPGFEPQPEMTPDDTLSLSLCWWRTHSIIAHPSMSECLYLYFHMYLYFHLYLYFHICLKKEIHDHTTLCYYWQPIYKGCRGEVN